MPQDRRRQSENIVDRRAEPAVDQGPGPAGEHQGLAGAGSRPPRHETPDPLDRGLVRSAGAHQRKDRLDDALADRNAAHEALSRHQLGDIHRRPRPVLEDSGGRDQHLPLCVDIRVIDIDLQQEAIELGFGQWIRTLLLERVLRRQDVKRPRQRMILAGDRHAALLHRLQQRRLRARAGSVDLVCH